MTRPEYTPELETDPRFPSGKWIGFYLMPHTGKTRHRQELILTFRSGRMTGEGLDKIGKFVIEGKYTVDDGRARWIKTYIGAHFVSYDGYNEGKGIWGVWEIGHLAKGGFHIWPEGFGIAQTDALHAEEPLPARKDDPTLVPV